MVVNVSERKLKYASKLAALFDTYQNVLLISADNVGSKQMQQVRMALRGRAEILMGKNTVMRKVLRDITESKPEVEALIPFIVGNVGFVFTNDDLQEVREVVESNKVPAAARPGAFAPVDVLLPPGPTGLDPGQTSFFQAMNIATKIARGSIEIINQVHLIKKDERVSASAVALLSKLGVKPFSFSIQVLQVYENGSLYAAKILDLSDDDMLQKFFVGVNLVAALSMQIGVPTLPAIPHYFFHTFQTLVAISLATEYTFERAQIFKDYLENPEAFAAAAGGGGGAAADAAAVAAPAAVEEPEEEEEEAAAADLFGDDDDY